MVNPHTHVILKGQIYNKLQKESYSGLLHKIHTFRCSSERKLWFMIGYSRLTHHIIWDNSLKLEKYAQGIYKSFNHTHGFFWKKTRESIHTVQIDNSAFLLWNAQLGQV